MSDIQANGATERGANAWRWPRIRLATASIFLLVFGAVGLVQASAVHAALAAEASATPSYAPYVWHLTGAFAAWTALPIVQGAVLNTTAAGLTWSRRFALHSFGYLSFVTVHVLVMLGLRWGVSYAWNISIPARSSLATVLIEAQSDVPIYAGLSVLWTLFVIADKRRQVQIHAAWLEARLAEARLEVLSGQLNPHFLFNALNTVSAVMYEDQPKADRLISELAEMLRATLGRGGATWPLAEECSYARRYVSLLEARFEDRLEVTWDVAPEADTVDVPRFAIQCLIENAAKHNADHPALLAIHVRVSLDQHELRIVVEDSGVGFEPGKQTLPPGHSLSRQEETLRMLYGDKASLGRFPSAHGGARVELAIPARAVNP